MSANLGPTLGALEIGVLISSMLFGVTTVQLYMYHRSNFKDPLWMRLLIVAIWTMESFHTIFVWIYLYLLTVEFYGIPSALAEPHWTLNISAFFDGLIGALVQSYFAYRIYVISGSLWIPMLSWIGSCLQFSGTLAVFVIGERINLVQFSQRFEWIVTVSLAFDVFVDFLNTASLSYLLFQRRSEFSKTNVLIDKLILWTIETGALTSLGAILMLVLSLSKSMTFLWIGISIFYAKLYSNSLLATFNGRNSIRGIRSNIHSSFLPSSHSDLSRRVNAPMQVNVTQDVELNVVGTVSSTAASKERELSDSRKFSPESSF